MIMANLDHHNAQDAVSTATDAARDALDKTADAVSGAVGKGSDAVSDTIRTATGAVSDAVGTARQNVSTGLRHVNEAVAEFSDKATDAAKKHPVRTVLLAAIGVAVAGFIAGVATSRRH